ncbi:SPEF1 protein, partial [Polypterus senegalus]
MAVELDEDALQELYTWVDHIPLSRPKKSIARDFSDGVLAAEIVNFFFPKMVELHNYVPASSTQQKLSNWGTLNRKVFYRLNFSIPEDVLRKVTQCSPGVVEIVLNTLKQKIEEKQKQNPNKSSAQCAQRSRRIRRHTHAHGRQLKGLSKDSSETYRDVAECTDSFSPLPADLSRESPPGPLDVTSGTEPMEGDHAGSGPCDVTSGLAPMAEDLHEPDPF